MLYTVKKSKLGALTFWRIIFFWLIIPLILIIKDLLKYSNESIEFYEDRIIHKSGILNKKVRQVAFSGVYSVSTEESLFGRIFKYGNVIVDAVDSWGDINTKNVKNPKEFAKFLENYIVR